MSMTSWYQNTLQANIIGHKLLRAKIVLCILLRSVDGNVYYLWNYDYESKTQTFQLQLINKTSSHPPSPFIAAIIIARHHVKAFKKLQFSVHE